MPRLELLFASALCGSLIGCTATTTVTTTPHEPPPTTHMIYVCHGNKEPKWIRVAESAADAHRRHDDRVSEHPQSEGEACKQ